MKKTHKILICIAAVLLLLGFFVINYFADYYHELPVIYDKTEDISYALKETGYGWMFDAGSSSAVIFYPGGKVEESSYMELCGKIANDGIDVHLVKMPLRFAIFGVNLADQIIDNTDYDHVYMCGHSLGGAMASVYASQHPDKVSGLILLAAYSSVKVPDNIKVLSIYGDTDRILNMRTYENNKKNLPKDMYEYIIRGGNHRQFGNYLGQMNDGTTPMTSDQQQTIAANVITSYMRLYTEDSTR